MSHDLPDGDWRQRFRRRLRRWYTRHARDLPWRRSRDPYAVWLSEIMLQQTQVATVEAYFARFLREFPTIEALAGADEQRVLRQWEGLGYYRRARQLHRAARLIVAEHHGAFPRDETAVRALPGIGRYTAGAILSIAFDRRLPILEGNTVRLFSRLLGYSGDPRSAAGQKRLWAMAEAVLPRRRVGEFNQALMELGSQVCMPRRPPCGQCPVAALCGAAARGLQSRIPRRPRRPPTEPLHEAAVLVRRRGRVLLVRCPEAGRWAGLWDFPRFAVEAPPGPRQRQELIEKVCRLSGATVEPGRLLATVKHGVTRFRITLDCYEAEWIATGKPADAGTEMKWLRGGELADYPLCTTGRKLARWA